LGVEGNRCADDDLCRIFLVAILEFGKSAKAVPLIVVRFSTLPWENGHAIAKKKLFKEVGFRTTTLAEFVLQLLPKLCCCSHGRNIICSCAMALLY
jgi:hypothetical protein